MTPVELARSVADIVTRRVKGTYSIDPWGFDAELTGLLADASRLQWSIELRGADHVPAEGPALVVFTRRYGISEPYVAAAALHRTRRPLRVVGVPDMPVVGPALRRLGGVLARPEEMTSLFRVGEVVAIPLSRTPRDRFDPGAIDPVLLEPALRLGVPVLPVALAGRELGRRWYVEIGAPIHTTLRSGPLADAELAEQVRAHVTTMLGHA